MLIITKTATGAIFRVRVQPGASKNEIMGIQQDALKIRINAPPVKGKANKALIDFLAKKLGVKKSQVEILGGHASRVKKIKIVGEGSKITEKIQAIILSCNTLNTLEGFRGILRGTKLNNIREEDREIS